MDHNQDDEELFKDGEWFGEQNYLHLSPLGRLRALCREIAPGLFIIGVIIIIAWSLL